MSSSNTYLTDNFKDKGVHYLPNLKAKEIAWLEFELTPCEVPAQYFIHYTMRTSPIYR